MRRWGFARTIDGPFNPTEVRNMKKQMMAFLMATTLVAPLAAPLTAFAGADCTDEPREKWMSEHEMQKKILDMGYTIERFKIDDTCYEIYGRTAENRKVEAYFNPVTGEVVKQEIDS